jgi:hypothetical protein
MALSPYQQLSAVFGFETSRTLPEILAMLMSEQEAHILLATPGAPDVLARKLPYDVGRLMETLDDLYLRGLVFIAEHTPHGPFYRLPDDVGCYMDSVLFDRHDDRLGASYFDLWREFVSGEFFAAKQKKTGDSASSPPASRAFRSAECRPRPNPGKPLSYCSSCNTQMPGSTYSPSAPRNESGTSPYGMT